MKNILDRHWSDARAEIYPIEIDYERMSRKKYKGEDGSAKAKAVIFLGAKSDFEEVDTGYDYLESLYGE